MDYSSDSLRPLLNGALSVAAPKQPIRIPQHFPTREYLEKMRLVLQNQEGHGLDAIQCLKIRYSFDLIGTKIYGKVTGKPLLVQEDADEVLRTLHDNGGHPGRDTLRSRIQDLYHAIPKMTVDRYIKACPQCKNRRPGFSWKPSKENTPSRTNPLTCQLLFDHAQQDNGDAFHSASASFGSCGFQFQDGASFSSQDEIEAMPVEMEAKVEPSTPSPQAAVEVSMDQFNRDQLSCDSKESGIERVATHDKRESSRMNETSKESDFFAATSRMNERSKESDYFTISSESESTQPVNVELPSGHSEPEDPSTKSPWLPQQVIPQDRPRSKPTQGHRQQFSVNDLLSKAQLELVQLQKENEKQEAVWKAKCHQAKLSTLAAQRRAADLQSEYYLKMMNSMQ